MRIAMIGTRGVPARYGGFETAVEEVGARLVQRGHDVVVYCRGDDRSGEYLGMRRVRLPSLRHASMETLSHTTLSVTHLTLHRVDVAVVFNAANAPLLPAIRAAGIPVAVHVDGLEWKRAKWGPGGRRYYLAGERLAVRWADALIADAPGIQEYYRTHHGADSRYLAYGAPVVPAPDCGLLAEHGLQPGGFHLVVARIEPENHVNLIVDGYLRSAARLPLIVVGSTPYPNAEQDSVRALTLGSSRVRLLGGVWDQGLLNSLYAGAASYLHGHSVGGTNPSLLRAMGAGTPVIAWRVNFNQDVLGDTGRYFTGPTEIAAEIELAESDPAGARGRGEAGRQRATARFRWDDVATGYEQLCYDLVRTAAAPRRSSPRILRPAPEGARHAVPQRRGRRRARQSAHP